MEKNIAEAIINMIEYIDDDMVPEVRLVQDYSGKNMFGEKTYAIETPDPYIIYVALGMVLKEQDELELEDKDDPEIREFNYKNLRIDQLGLNFIVY